MSVSAQQPANREFIQCSDSLSSQDDNQVSRKLDDALASHAHINVASLAASSRSASLSIRQRNARHVSVAVSLIRTYQASNPRRPYQQLDTLNLTVLFPNYHATMASVHLRNPIPLELEILAEGQSLRSQTGLWRLPC